MESLSKDKIKEFGNPAAYRENLLYNMFCDHGKEDLFYQLVFYGLHQDEGTDVPLNSKYRNLLSKKINYQQKRIKRISEFIYLTKKPGLWLDMGCGVGQFINQIIQSKGNSTVGTETSFNTLKKASFLLNKLSHNKNYCLVNQDSMELPFKDNAFDYILSADVIEHVGYDKQKKVISEMYRVLKKGGYVIIHTPNLNRVILSTFFKKIYYLFKGFNPLIIKHSFAGGHISLTTPNRLKTICRSVGFDARIPQKNNLKLSCLYKWALSGLSLLFSRSFILILSKKISY